mmetsp:Transcript_23990/g.60013  ORF Transcript_23990/g.60013 Transcript_23990/m.60013 type:complete len:307 (-) Transcript_23990:44-964(-)
MKPSNEGLAKEGFAPTNQISLALLALRRQTMHLLTASNGICVTNRYITNTQPHVPQKSAQLVLSSPHDQNRVQCVFFVFFVRNVQFQQGIRDDRGWKVIFGWAEGIVAFDPLLLTMTRDHHQDRLERVGEYHVCGVNQLGKVSNKQSSSLLLVFGADRLAHIGKLGSTSLQLGEMLTGFGRNGLQELTCGNLGRVASMVPLKVAHVIVHGGTVHRERTFDAHVRLILFDKIIEPLSNALHCLLHLLVSLLDIVCQSNVFAKTAHLQHGNLKETGAAERASLVLQHRHGALLSSLRDGDDEKTSRRL